MQLPPLICGELVRRYKRFLADVILADGRQITVHCPNTGAMTGCADPGSAVWLSVSDNPKRKYAHTLELVESVRGVVSVNTGRANGLVKEALLKGLIAEVDHTREPDQIISEAAIPDESGRFDFLVQGRHPTYVEVKSVTLCADDGWGSFPDAVSQRALKHVSALARQVAQGHRALLLFCVQHQGIKQMRLAADIDPAYAMGVNAAMSDGVQVAAYGCELDGKLETMQIKGTIPFVC